MQIQLCRKFFTSQSYLKFAPMSRPVVHFPAGFPCKHPAAPYPENRKTYRPCRKMPPAFFLLHARRHTLRPPLTRLKFLPSICSLSPQKGAFAAGRQTPFFSKYGKKGAASLHPKGRHPFLSVFCVPLCKREIGLAGEPPSQKHRPLKTPGRTPRPVRRCPFQSPPWSGRRNSCGRYFCAVHGSRRPRPACRPFWPWE